VPGPLAAIVFDVGETIVDETRFYAILADHLRVPRLTFFAIAGAMIARGGTHRDAFELFRPGIDLQAELDRLGEAGQPVVVSLDDLYPDALPCLRELASAGYRLGIAANQPEATAHVLAELDIPLELIATSAGWGIEKPARAFFDRIGAELGLPHGQIAYVGDRLDNDVRPARAAGMVAVWVRRGPWAWIQAGRGVPREPALVVEDLATLPGKLRAAGLSPPP